MKLELLPSTIERNGSAPLRQHLTTMVVDDKLALDAGSLAIGTTDAQRATIRDIIISHAHLDHIAGLPLFLDDLFATLEVPVRIHASRSVVEVLEENIFNWKVYPKFSELENEFGRVMEYVVFQPGEEFQLPGYRIVPIEVNHKVQSFGFIVSDGETTLAVTGDTAPTDVFWARVNGLETLDALVVECAFPNELTELAAASYHLTPQSLAGELGKFNRKDCRVYVSNIKPIYREVTISEIAALDLEGVEILEVGRKYSWPY